MCSTPSKMISPLMHCPPSPVISTTCATIGSSAACLASITAAPSRWCQSIAEERQNWCVRTTMRLYTRLSNGFSRKIEKHAAAIALNYFAYNFIKIYRTLRVAPAMAASVTDRLWDASDLVSLLEAEEREERAA